MDGLAKHLRWSAVARGIIAIVFGILALVWPELSLLALVILFAIYAMGDGVVAIFGAFASRDISVWARVGYVLLGLLGLAAGVVALVWPGITAVALAWVIGFWALVAGVSQIVSAFGLRADVGHVPWLTLLSGILTLALGVIILVRPATGALTLVTVIGALAVVWGIVLIAVGINIGHAAAPRGAH